MSKLPLSTDQQISNTMIVSMSRAMFACVQFIEKLFFTFVGVGTSISSIVPVVLYYICIGLCERNISQIWFRGAKSELCFITKLAARDREERETTEFEMKDEILNEVPINKARRYDQTCLITRRETTGKWRKNNSWQEVWFKKNNKEWMAN